VRRPLPPPSDDCSGLRAAELVTGLRGEPLQTAGVLRLLAGLFLAALPEALE
jgi:hypothetical protein